MFGAKLTKWTKMDQIDQKGQKGQNRFKILRATHNLTNIGLHCLKSTKKHKRNPKMHQKCTKIEQNQAKLDQYLKYF